MNFRFSSCFLFLSLLTSISGFSGNCLGQEKNQANKNSKTGVPIPDQPYSKFTTRDRLGRQITFYLSEAAAASRKPLPLVLFVEGSGCGSRFEERAGRILSAGGHIVAADVFKDKARVLVVEKPGVKYLDQPPRGDCRTAAEFNREHTLERWAEANEAAIRAVRRFPSISQNKMLVVGHSEGGLVACRIARDSPSIVTHVASLAGGGASQLFDILSLARQGVFFDQVSPDPEARVQYVLNEWKSIEADPGSAEKFFFGFAYRRWSTFLASSPIEELSASRANIYIAQGTEDKAVEPVSADTLYAQLTAKNRSVTYDRVKGANHSFRIKEQPTVDGWQELFERIAEWFL